MTATEARNAYLRKWRSEHKEKVKAYNSNYWNKKAEQAERENNTPCTETKEAKTL